jgi:hypothetical protein
MMEGMEFLRAYLKLSIGRSLLLSRDIQRLNLILARSILRAIELLEIYQRLRCSCPWLRFKGVRLLNIILD